MITTAETYHVPVLLNESIDGLDIKSDGIYIDVTFGGGGHSMAPQAVPVPCCRHGEGGSRPRKGNDAG